MNDIDEHATSISVVFDNMYFENMRSVYDVVITGNSLPKQIYKDEKYICDGAEKHYHTVSLPSIFTGQTKDENNTVLTFKCFGTDRQSIKINACK